MESAGVPKGLQSLAEKIRKLSDWREKFCQSDAEEAEQWLRANLDLGEFIKTFGHRCLKEFELESERWGENLRPVVSTLQAMLSVTTQPQSQVSLEVSPPHCSITSFLLSTLTARHLLEAGCLSVLAWRS